MKVIGVNSIELADVDLGGDAGQVPCFRKPDGTWIVATVAELQSPRVTNQLEAAYQEFKAKEDK